MKSKIIDSKVAALIALFLTIILIVFTAILRSPWWEYIALFFLFMCVFSHLISLLLRRGNPPSSRSLDKISFIFMILAILGFLATYIISNIGLNL